MALMARATSSWVCRVYGHVMKFHPNQRGGIRVCERCGDEASPKVEDNVAQIRWEATQGKRR
jgi:hypothetical protein